MALSIQVVIDCADPDKVAHFWADALHYKIQDPPTGYDSWEAFLQAHHVPEDQWTRASAIVDPAGKGPRIFFQRVPEAKTVKNRVHLDINASQLATDPAASQAERQQRIITEAGRLTELGARELYRMEEFGNLCITMADPENNEFCVQ
ncbi:glyoxalase [Dictyobacter alpinus]|uniref:Glyoxalase n=1 Tax=Dictyobacter alpinus TaxID=2014873 RepID=A0A402BC56_9CHLR|nr:VOC family protein [Dictyobacter alpinus]GCE28988.1 glyoxalase [Dictyobacter alpinus]